MTALLDVHHLTTRIPTDRGLLTAVNDVSFTLQKGEIFGVVGESGSGKSMTCRSILGMVPPPGRVTARKRPLESFAVACDTMSGLN